MLGARNSSPDALVKLCPTCELRYPADFKVCPKDATELVEASNEEQDELVGKTIQQSYTIVRVLGEGGMGRVYEARHTRITGKRFAIKMLHPEYARQTEVLTRFQREAEAAASIQSPNVVDVYDVDRTEDGRPFMVAELLNGQDFSALLDEKGKLPVGPTVHIVRQVCRALIAAHERGVVHRDMKPENVFLTGDLTRPLAKVIDFGISKVGDPPDGGGKRTALTKTGMVMGTPSYMAPEQARGERVDHRADIYAVGAILYTALTGRRPFDRDDPTATLAALLMSVPERPRTIEPSIPESLELVIQKAMARDPADRYASMAELDHDLIPWDNEVTALAPAGPSSMSRPSVASMDAKSREAAMARPMIVLFTALTLVWGAGSLTALIAAIVRLSRGGGATANLSGAEAVFLIVGLMLALATPVGLGARWVLRNVWSNSVKAVELASVIRRPALVGLTAYGFMTILVRVFEVVVLRRAAGVAWPVWDVLLFVVGAAAVGGAYFLFGAEKKKA